MQSLKKEKGLVYPPVLFHAHDVLVEVLEDSSDSDGDSPSEPCFFEGTPAMKFPNDLTAGIKMVEFCGQVFSINSLLSIPIGDPSPRVGQFAAFMEDLNMIGLLTQDDPRAGELRVFVSSDKTAIFMGAVSKLTEFTSWKVEFMPSRINPTGGLEARVIVPS